MLDVSIQMPIFSFCFSSDDVRGNGNASVDIKKTT